MKQRFSSYRIPKKWGKVNVKMAMNLLMYLRRFLMQMIQKRILFCFKTAFYLFFGYKETEQSATKTII